MFIDTPRTARRILWLMFLPLVFVVLLSTPLAIHHKDVEYRVALQLEESGLPLFDQAVLMTAVHQLSDFDPAAEDEEGGRGLLLLAPAEARAHGLRVEDARQPAHRNLFKRLVKPAARAAEQRSDQRLDPALQLAAGIGRYRDLSRQNLSQMPPGLPAAEELAGYLVLIREPEQRRLVFRALALPRFAQRVSEKPDAALVAIEEVVAEAEDLAPPEIRHELERKLLSSRVYVETFRRMLPRVQDRASPTLTEYANSLKSVLVQLFGLDKWLMHLLLGSVFFFASTALLLLLGRSPFQAALISAILVGGLAVGIEIADWYDARLTAKEVTFLGAVLDILVTTAIPLAYLLWAVRRGRAPSR